jgi:hypothetical protein
MVGRSMMQEGLQGAGFASAPASPAQQQRPPRQGDPAAYVRPASQCPEAYGTSARVFTRLSCHVHRQHANPRLDERTQRAAARPSAAGPIAVARPQGESARALYTRVEATSQQRLLVAFGCKTWKYPRPRFQADVAFQILPQLRNSEIRKTLYASVPVHPCRVQLHRPLALGRRRLVLLHVLSSGGVLHQLPSTPADLVAPAGERDTHQQQGITEG